MRERRRGKRRSKRGREIDDWKGKRETDRQRHTERDRDRDIQRETDRDRDRETTQLVFKIEMQYYDILVYPGIQNRVQYQFTL